MGAWTEQLILQTLPRPLAGHFDQTQFGYFQDIASSFVFFERVLESIVDFFTIGFFLHIDKVDDNDAAYVSQTQLPHDFLSRLQIGPDDGLFLISFANKSSGIDVNGRQSLRSLDDDIAPGTEPDAPIQRFCDFFLDSVAVEQGLCARVQNNLGFEPRHKLTHEIHDAAVVFARINYHLFGVRRKKITNRSGYQIQILVDQ